VSCTHVLDQYTQEEQLEFAAYDTRLNREVIDQNREPRDAEGSGRYR
jgi:hypothetical protein